MRSGGCCNNGWDNDYHPVATAAAVTATVAVTSAVIGSMVRTVPRQLRTGQLRRHDLSAVRQHLVSAAGIAVRRDQSAVLMSGRRGRHACGPSCLPRIQTQGIDGIHLSGRRRGGGGMVEGQFQADRRRCGEAVESTWAPGGRAKLPEERAHDRGLRRDCR